MESASLSKDLEYKENGPAVTVLFETTFTKEIRIAMKAGQAMQEHQTPYPIVVEIFEGVLDFGVNGEVHHLKKGDLAALDGGTPHDLTAIEDTVIRLTLTKSDAVARVESVLN